MSTQEAFVAPGTELEKLAGDFQFTEGPVWFDDEQALYFSDIPASITRRWSEAKGIEVLRSPNDKSNGMFRDDDGKLLVCQHGKRRIVKWHGGDEVEVVVDSYGGKKFNSPNDIIVRKDGCIYFTDPPYGLTAEFGELGEQELPYQGVFRTNVERTKVVLLNNSMFRPNGLAFSPDQKLLYVNDSEHELINVFDVTGEGDLTNERLFVEVKGDDPGNPDGMKIDTEGNVYVTGPGGLWIFDPAGQKCGFIQVPEPIGNFAFGEGDMKAIFFTASTSLYRIRVNIAGI
jgi:gluconolactonase